MSKIFRQVFAEERLPNKTGLYHTNRGMINYFHGLKTFEHSISIDYWLEEIELPTDEETRNYFNRKYDSTFEQVRERCFGAKEMIREFVLSAIPKREN